MKKSIVIGAALLMFVFNVTAQNYALRFFGNGVDDIDRVKIPLDDPEKNVNVGYDFTIEFQMKAELSENPLGGSAVQGNNDDWVLGHVIVDRDIFGPGDYGDYGISIVNGRIAFGVNNGENSYTIIGNSIVADGTWQHIALTRNSATGEIAIFINGNLDNSALTDVLGNISHRSGRYTDWENDPYLVLGAEKHDYDTNLYPSYSGYLDELRISDIVRYTENYAPQIFLNDDANTVALYNFNEGEGNILYDNAAISGNNSDGVIMFGGEPFGPVWTLNDIGEEEQIEITVNILPEDAGYITGDGTYQLGSNIELSAFPNQGFDFSFWSENGVFFSDENPLAFTATEDRIITAEFELTTDISVAGINSNIIVFPNPNDGILKIYTDKTIDEKIEAKIYSNTYKLEKIITFDALKYNNYKSINVSDLLPGVYFLIITYNDKYEVHKFVKL